jgi:tRNA (adenine22-N1)-methyltransferase
VIAKEKLIFEDGKYYPVLRAEAGRSVGQAEYTGWKKDVMEKRGIAPSVMQEAEDMFGPVLLKDRDPILFEFLTRRTAVLHKILVSISQAVQDTCKDPALLQRHLARKREIEHDITVFTAALAVYDQ